MTDFQSAQKQQQQQQQYCSGMYVLLQLQLQIRPAATDKHERGTMKPFLNLEAHGSVIDRGNVTHEKSHRADDPIEFQRRVVKTTKIE